MIPELDHQTGLCRNSAHEHGIVPKINWMGNDNSFFSAWQRAVPEGSELLILFPISAQAFAQVGIAKFRRFLRGIGRVQLQLFRALRNNVIFLFSLAMSFVILLPIFAAPQSIVSRLRFLVRVWARSLLTIMRCRIELSGLEHIPAQGALFAAQHTGLLDTFLFPAILPLNTVYFGKVELAKIPFFASVYRKLGNHFVDRSQGVRELLRFVEVGAERARNSGRGQFYFIHPQGTRKADGEIGVLKSGALVLSDVLNLPVVPVVSAGGSILWPKGSFFPRRGKILIEFLPPLSHQSFANNCTIQKFNVRTLSSKLQSSMEAGHRTLWKRWLESNPFFAQGKLEGMRGLEESSIRA
jgi:1-acyl-sn-glycerol-3-phosphate acyltransferase